MQINFSELMQFCLVIIGIVSLIVQINQAKKK